MVQLYKWFIILLLRKIHYQKGDNLMKPDNPTFSSKGPFQYNACVGKNGFNDINTYEDGFHDAAMILLDQLMNKGTHHVDTLVYPILFSARHRIELFLKWLISELKILNEMKNRKYTKLTRTNIHDLKILWEYAEDISQVDQRYCNPIDELKCYVQDYFDIDLTGETFRYPFNNNNQQHLEDRSLINMFVFARRYEAMSNVIDHVDWMTCYVRDEYIQGTFSGDLSRNQLEEISEKLPDHSTWSDLEFDKVIEGLKHEYNISKRKLSIAINVIRGHRQFARNIGLPIKVNEIDKETFQNVKSITKTLFSSVDRSDSELDEGSLIFDLSEFEFRTADASVHVEYHEQLDKLLSDLALLLSENNCAAICTFYEIGRRRLYSETYDLIVKENLSKGNCLEEASYVLQRHKSFDCIETGMYICGQDHLYK